MPRINTRQLLGDTIREIREQREMTQQQLAEASGIHRVNVIGIEKGRLNPSAATLIAIARGLQILPSELFRRFNRRIMKALAGEPQS